LRERVQRVSAAELDVDQQATPGSYLGRRW
jgi:hypothetical protein